MPTNGRELECICTDCCAQLEPYRVSGPDIPSIASKILGCIADCVPAAPYNPANWIWSPHLYPFNTTCPCALRDTQCCNSEPQVTFEVEDEPNTLAGLLPSARETLNSTWLPSFSVPNFFPTTESTSYLDAPDEVTSTIPETFKNAVTSLIFTSNTTTETPSQPFMTASIGGDQSASGYCGTPFWNSSLLLEDIPRVTPCFENTVLIAIPTLFLITFGTLSILRSRHHEKILIPFGCLLTFKYVLTVFMILIYSTNSILYTLHHTSLDVRIATIIKAFDVCFSLTIQLIHRSRGKGYSGTVLLFWILFSLCETPAFYQRVLGTFWSIKPVDLSKILNMVATPAAFVQIGLSAINDAASTTDKCPLKEASPLSKALFLWFNQIVYKAFKNPIEENDLSEFPDELATSTNIKSFFDIYDEEISIFRAIWKMHCLKIWYASIITFLEVLLRTMTGLILGELIFHASSAKGKIFGIQYCLLLFLINTIASGLKRYAHYIMLGVGIQIKGVFWGVLCHKIIMSSNRKPEPYNVKRLQKHSIVCGQLLETYGETFNLLTGALSSIAITTPFIYAKLGKSAMIGIVLGFTLMFVCQLFIRLAIRNIKIIWQYQHDRLELVSEMLEYIKCLKLYAWELPLLRRVFSARRDEMSFHARLAGFFSTIASCKYPAGQHIICISLVMYTWFFQESPEALTVKNAIVAFWFCSSLWHSISALPNLVTNERNIAQSLEDLEEFVFSEPERDPVGEQTEEGEVLTLNKASFVWPNTIEPVLYDISLSVQKSSLVGLAGRHGAGKTSLLYSILGDVTHVGGTVDLIATIAYCPQTPWIMATSVQENILLTKKYDKSLYNTVLDICCLRPNLEDFSAGDMTEIDDSLPLDVKHKINLARALYHQRELYLIDETLSFLKKEEAADIFKNVFSNAGMLKDHSRLIVSNEATILEKCDVVYILDDGHISAEGTFQFLKKTYPPLPNILSLPPDVDKEFFMKDHLTLPEPESIYPVLQYDNYYSSPEPNNLAVSGEVPLNFNVYAHFLFFMKWYVVIFLLGFVIAFQIVDIAACFFLVFICKDTPTFTDTPLKLRFIYFGLAGIVYGILGGIIACLTAKAARNISRTLHNTILKRAVYAPLSYFDSNPQQNILNRLKSDIEIIDFQLPVAGSTLLIYLGQAFGVVILLCYFCKEVIPLFGIIITVSVAFIALYIKTRTQLLRMHATSVLPICVAITEAFHGRSVIRAFGVTEKYLGYYFGEIDCHQNLGYLLGISKLWLATRLDIFMNLVASVLCMIVVLHYKDIHYTTAAVLFYNVLTLYWVFNSFGQHIEQCKDVLHAAARCLEFFNVAPESDDANSIVSPDWPVLGSVSFDRYSTRYRPGLDLALKNFNIDVHGGEKVFIVGPDQAGKSTVIMALFRLVEAAEGKIVIDETNIAHISLHTLRSRLAIVPQETIIFNGTLRFNIDPHAKYSDEAIWKALELCNVKEKMNISLDQDISHLADTAIRRLICFARAVVKKPKIVVIDEEKDEFGPEMYRMLDSIVQDAFEDSTVIRVTHQAESIGLEDEVIFIKKGHIVEKGPQISLLRSSGSTFNKYFKK